MIEDSKEKEGIQNKKEDLESSFIIDLEKDLKILENLNELWKDNYSKMIN